MMDTVSISEKVGQAKIDQVDLVSIGADAHDKVTWLDVTVDNTRTVKLLKALDLNCDSSNNRHKSNNMKNTI